MDMDTWTHAQRYTLNSSTTCGRGNGGGGGERGGGHGDVVYGLGGCGGERGRDAALWTKRTSILGRGGMLGPKPKRQGHALEATRKVSTESIDLQRDANIVPPEVGTGWIRLTRHNKCQHQNVSWNNQRMLPPLSFCPNASIANTHTHKTASTGKHPPCVLAAIEAPEQHGPTCWLVSVALFFTLSGVGRDDVLRVQNKNRLHRWTDSVFENDGGRENNLDALGPVAAIYNLWTQSRPTGRPGGYSDLLFAAIFQQLFPAGSVAMCITNPSPLRNSQLREDIDTLRTLVGTVFATPICRGSGFIWSLPPESTPRFAFLRFKFPVVATLAYAEQTIRDLESHATSGRLLGGVISISHSDQTHRCHAICFLKCEGQLIAIDSAPRDKSVRYVPFGDAPSLIKYGERHALRSICLVFERVSLFSNCVVQ